MQIARHVHLLAGRMIEIVGRLENQLFVGAPKMHINLVMTARLLLFSGAHSCTIGRQYWCTFWSGSVNSGWWEPWWMIQTIFSPFSSLFFFSLGSSFFFLLEEYLHGYRKFVRKWGRGGERREMKRRTLFRDCVLVRVIFQGKRIFDMKRSLREIELKDEKKFLKDVKLKFFLFLILSFFFLSSRNIL